MTRSSKLIFALLGICALAAAGCGVEGDDITPNGDESGLSGKGTTPSKGGVKTETKDDACYKACVGKGAGFEMCKKACYGGDDKAKKGGCDGKAKTDKGTFDHKCYFACVKKGYDAGDCKKKCYATTKSRSTKAGCKKWTDKTSGKTCWACWDAKGKVTKKGCGSGKTTKAGCKAYQDKASGKYCMECWDDNGKPTLNTCKK